ncbi:WD40 repeat domain-containing protein [Duganella sp. CF458]|uniref:WD40 repeat domain-containing protein n=1 Tax=Duganella sp. CF458 TaxID=1884368 RepID=UPI0011146810|nr:hypothetical protein [Duganella sp. CF458]
MPRRFFAEVVCLSANGEFLAAAHFRDSAKRGVVHLFQCRQGHWSNAGAPFEGSLPGLYLGNALALSADGRTLAIAGDGNKKTAGCVALYQFRDGHWHPKGAPLRGKAATHFGSSVALSADGNIVAIGQRSAAGGGAVHVFRYAAGSWQRHGAVLGAAAAQGDFGIAVSLCSTGERLAVGANSFKAGLYGSVSVFHYAGQAWQLRGAPIRGGLQSHFGTAVKLCAAGETVAVGSPSCSNGRGSVRVYRFRAGHWRQLGETLAGEHPQAFMGNAVDLSEDGRMLVAGSDGLAGASGAVLVYLFDGSRWQRSSVTLFGEAGNSYFGLSVSLSTAGGKIASANLNVLNDSVVHRFTLADAQPAPAAAQRAPELLAAP